MNKSRNQTLLALFAIVLLGAPQAVRALQVSSQPATSTQATKSEQKKTEKKPPPTNRVEKKDHELQIEKIDPDVLIASDSAQDQTLTIAGATDGETLNVVGKGHSPRMSRSPGRRWPWPRWWS